MLRNDLRNNLLYNVPGDRGETDQSVVPHIRLYEKWVLEHLAVCSHHETSVVDWLFFLPVIVEALLCPIHLLVASAPSELLALTTLSLYSEVMFPFSSCVVCPRFDRCPICIWAQSRVACSFMPTSAILACPQAYWNDWFCVWRRLFWRSAISPDLVCKVQLYSLFFFFARLEITYRLSENDQWKTQCQFFLLCIYDNLDCSSWNLGGKNWKLCQIIFVLCGIWWQKDLFQMETCPTYFWVKIFLPATYFWFVISTPWILLFLFKLKISHLK